MKLSKKTAGSVGEYVWDKAEAVVEVADEFATELIGLDPHEFSHVEDKPAAKKAPAKKAAASADKPADVDADSE